MTVIDEPLVLADLDEISFDEWLEQRQHGLGGSDAGAIAGLNPWTPPVKVWGQKLGITPPDDDNESMFWGRRLETPIAEVFAERHPELEVWSDRRMLAHPERPYLFANMDRRVGEDELLEVKTADKHMVDEWAGGPPIHYQFQFQHYCYVAGLAGGWVAVLLGGNRYREFRLDRDDELIETLVAMEDRFWNEHVVPRTPPPVIGTTAEAEWLRDTYGGDHGREVLLDADAIEAFDRLCEVKLAEASLKQDRLLYENMIKAAMGDATEGIDPRTTSTLVTWRPHTENAFDLDTFRAEHPELAANYTGPAPRRPFKPKYPKET